MDPKYRTPRSFPHTAILMIHILLCFNIFSLHVVPFCRWIENRKQLWFCITHQIFAVWNSSFSGGKYWLLCCQSIFSHDVTHVNSVMHFKSLEMYYIYIDMWGVPSPGAFQPALTVPALSCLAHVPMFPSRSCPYLHPDSEEHTFYGNTPNFTWTEPDINNGENAFVSLTDHTNSGLVLSTE